MDNSAGPASIAMEFKSLASGPWVRRTFYLLLAAAELYIIVGQAQTEDLLWVPVALGLIAAFTLLMFWWPYGALLGLVASQLFSHYYILVNGWKLRPEHAVAVAAAAIFVLRVLFRRHRTDRATIFDYLLAGFLVLNYLSSAFFSVDAPRSLRWALLTNLAVLPYFLVRFSGSGQRYVTRIFRYVLWLGLFEAAYGILGLLLWHFSGIAAGVELNHYVGMTSVRGTMYFSAAFGGYTACCSVMFLALWLFGEGRRRPRYAMGALVTCIAALASLGRGEILGLLAGVIFISYLAVRRKVVSRGKLLSMGVAAVLLLSAILVASVGPFIAARFRNLGGQSESIRGRVLEVLVALPGIEQHPLLGNGTNSSKLLADEGGPLYRSLTGGSYLELFLPRVLYDTGAVGLGLFGTLIVLLWRRTRKVIRRLGRRELSLLAAMTAVVLVELVASQLEDPTLMGFPWLFLGLFVSVLLDYERTLSSRGRLCR